MASVPIVNAWTEWAPLELVCVGTARGMCYPDETLSFPWHVAPKSLERYIRTISGPRPQRRIEEAQAQLDNLAELLRGESVMVADSLTEIFNEDIGRTISRKETSLVDSTTPQNDPRILNKKSVQVCRPDEDSKDIRFDHRLATPHFQSQYQVGLACPRDILMTLGDTVVEAPTCVQTRYFESQYYKPLLYSLWKQDSNMKWLQPPKPTCSPKGMFNDVDYWKKIHWKDLNNGLFSKRGYKTNLNENEIAFDTADIMRMGKDIFYKKSSSANNQGLLWLRRTFPNLRFHMMHFPNDVSYHLDVSLIPLRPPTSGSEGLILLNRNFPPLSSEMRIFLENDWRPVWAPMYSVAEVPPLALCSGNLNANLLSINENCVVIEESEISMYQMLHDEFGFDVITCPLRVLNEFGGGFHCGKSKLSRFLNRTRCK